MASASIHQAIHGYRDGHRLLSSSITLSGEAARAMLVLSDMSGPSMQPGFDEYLTGYPLPGTELFVLAKTWSAPEMQRPGCVWTHSLLISRSHLSDVTPAGLLDKFRRPQLEGVDSAATTPLMVDDHVSHESDTDGFANRAVAAALVSALLGQPRPVIVAADTADQFEAVILRLWEQLWPAERARFSFCTGALTPRSSAGSLLDLQAVPRATPSSQIRKNASAALVLDLRSPATPAAWVESILDGAARGDATFRHWLEAAAGADAGRSVVPSLAPIFGEWYAPSSSARSILASVMNATNLEPSARSRLVGMLFDRAGMEAGATRRRELLKDLCGYSDPHLASLVALTEDQVRQLFMESRAEGVALALSLLGSELTEAGERVLRAALLLFVPGDLEMLEDAHSPFLPTIVGANPSLASSSVLWKRVGDRSVEVLSQLGSAQLKDEERGRVVDAIISSERDISVEALVRFAGKTAIFHGLTALATGQIHLSWPWRSVLSAHPDAVLEWLESLPSPSQRDLELGSRFLSPHATQMRLGAVWKSGIAGPGPLGPRVAAFGLALGFWEGAANSTLLLACFQPTYDAAATSRLEHEEWDWLREHAPSVSWYRDWDRCERLAAAVARLFEKQDTCLETVLGVVRSRAAIKKVVATLDNDRGMRPYLRSLRKAAAATVSTGTPGQRDALLE